MKLSNLGVKFIVDGEPADAPSSNRPTKLFFSGRPSYLLCSSKWGFILEPQDDMLTFLVGRGINASFARRDLLPIIVDCPGFAAMPPANKMKTILAAISARTSAEQSTFIAGAINWWLDQVLEKESQSP